MRWIVWALVVGVTACVRPGASPVASDGGASLVASDGLASTVATDGGAGAVGTPVRVAIVGRATVAVRVSGPGRTDALEQQKVRAPFAGTLTSLRVEDGDHVRGGQIVGTVVSRTSEAALVGARAMLAAAHTPAARRDALRAVELARQSLVQTPLRAPEAGVVVKHGADEGSLVTEGEDIVSLAAVDSFVFIAEIVQTDVSRVHAGQPAELRLPSRAEPLRGRVHAVLPSGSTNDLSVPVRIDLPAAPALAAPVALGLFGTATITIGEHRDATVAPAAAILRDDVSGVSRIATVGVDERARWVRVTPGIADGELVEIVAPALSVGEKVIVAGQVGLPEGAPVRVDRVDGVER